MAFFGLAAAGVGKPGQLVYNELLMRCFKALAVLFVLFFLVPAKGCILDLAKSEMQLAGDGHAEDAEGDWADTPPADSEIDSGPAQCSDGIDNDNDDLVDMDDIDCVSPWDPVEGPETGECTSDNHCDGGWLECDRHTNTCYDPPGSSLCDVCDDIDDCGDRVVTENPDADFCLYWGGDDAYCAKDCLDEGRQLKT